MSEIPRLLDGLLQHLQVAQRARQMHQHAHVAFALDRRLLARRQSRLDLAHLPLGGAQQPVDQRGGIGLQRAMALAKHLPPPRDRRQRFALIGERIAVETGIEGAERHFALGEDARDREAFRIHLARADDARQRQRRIGFGLDVG
jgi:hypothetical protein